ncbi:MAG: septal ring lytic transglycosylase RlpA family protein [Blastomonas sp.]
MKSGVETGKGALAAALASLVLLAGCGTIGGGKADRPNMASQGDAGVVADYPVLIGEPYKMQGITYVPQDIFNYDETGYASWYGAELGGRRTANGEIFDPQGVTGAHRTLPLPSYVEVTNLDTGTTILVRLNDRGPSSPDRLIDLSYGAARQLGIVERGVAAVRVRRVNPPEQERAVLRGGGQAAERLETPESLLKVLRGKLTSKTPPPAPAGRMVPGMAVAGGPPPGYPAGPSAPASATTSADGRFIIENEGAPTRTAAPTPAASSSASTDVVVQVAAFSSRERADDLARKIGARVMPNQAGTVWRVRYGPYANEAAAQEGIQLARRNGYGDARILRAN